MPKRINIALRISTAILVFSGYLALASVNTYGMLLIVPPIIIIFFSPIGERLDANYPTYQTFLRALQIAYACFIPLTYFALGLLLGVILLVMFIQAMLLIRKRNERENYYVFMMAFFLLLAACVSAPEPMIAVAIFLFLVSSIWCFVLIRFQAEMESTPANQPEIIPVSGTVMRMEKAGNLFDAGLVGSMVAMTFSSFVITAGLFFVIPRVEAGFIGGGELPVATTGAGSDRVDVASGNVVLENLAAVMYVAFPELPNRQYPEPNNMYWRLFPLTRYENAAWSRADMEAHLEGGLPDRPFEVQYTNPLSAKRTRKAGRQELVQQEIYVDSLPEEGVPALHLVQQVVLDKNVQGNARVSWDMDRYDFSLKLAKRGARAVNYTAWSEIPRNNAERLRAVQQDYVYVPPRDFRMLTYHDLRPETQASVAALIADAPTLYDKVKRIETYLSGPDFTYTLDVPSLPPDHPIDAFLTEVRRGHCERFASAMALMLRSQGIPARVVAGYRGGDWDEGGESYIIRNSMAHLWVEVLFPGVGWVIFDPSPRADETDLAALGRMRMAYANYALRAKLFWYQNVIQFDRGLQISSLRELGLRALSPFQQLTESTRDLSTFSRNWAGRLIMGAFIIALALFLVWSWQARPERSRQKLSEDQKRAIQMYGMLRKKLVHFGLDCSGKTAEELMREGMKINWSDPEILYDALRCYNESRFGLRPFGKADYQQLSIRLKQLQIPQAEA